jgi:hypothetical protein
VERRIYILNIYTNGKIVYIICPYISVLDQAQAQERVHNPMEDLVRYRKQSLSRSLGLLRTAKEEAHPPTFFVCLRPPQKSTENPFHWFPWEPMGSHRSPCVPWRSLTSNSRRRSPTWVSSSRVRVSEDFRFAVRDDAMELQPSFSALNCRCNSCTSPAAAFNCRALALPASTSSCNWREHLSP